MRLPFGISPTQAPVMLPVMADAAGQAVNYVRENPLQGAAIATTPVPVVGDVMGLLADADMYANDPESRNLLNYGLSTLGVLPFVPSVAQLARRGSKNTDTSYRLMHTPTKPSDGAARLDDMTGGGTVFPSDIYTPDGLRLYGNEKNKYDKESFEKIQSLKGKPDAEVTIYRAAPKGIRDINEGDFVTLSHDYAKLHAESGYGSGGDEAGEVIKMKVKVKDLYSDGNDLNEFGYFPADTQLSNIDLDVEKAKKAYEANPNNDDLRREYLYYRNLRDLNNKPKTEAEIVADEVLGLLKSGDAEYITDEMLSKADDVYLAKNYDLPMDTSSRLARAREMGFDLDNVMYHGTGGNFDKFDTNAGRGFGIFTTNNPKVAETYAPMLGGSIYPVVQRDNSVDLGEIIVDAEGANWNRIERDMPAYAPEVGYEDVGFYFKGDNGFFYDPTNTNDLSMQARNQGRPKVVFENIVDRGGARYLNDSAYNVPTTVTANFYSNALRSPFARFDPRLKNSGNLLASVAPIAVVTPAVRGGLLQDTKTNSQQDPDNNVGLMGF